MVAPVPQFNDVAAINEVDKLVIFIDSPRPTSGEYIVRRRRSVNSLEWITHGLVEHSIQSPQHGPALTLPEAVVAPVKRENQPHQLSTWVSHWPPWARASGAFPGNSARFGATKGPPGD